jgi:hypothetical protein
MNSNLPVSEPLGSAYSQHQWRTNAQPTTCSNTEDPHGIVRPDGPARGRDKKAGRFGRRTHLQEPRRAQDALRRTRRTTGRLDDAALHTSAAIDSGEAKLSSDWAGFKKSTSEGLAGLRDKHAERRVARDAKRAEKGADRADDFAAECIAWAIYAVVAAEYALVDAALAHADADAAAAATAGTTD